MNGVSEAPRKKRFQVHLSTAVVLMIAAGGILWANSRGNSKETSGLILDAGWPKAGEARGTEADFRNRMSAEHWFGRRIFSYGWPSEVLLTSVPIVLNKSDGDFRSMDHLLKYRDIQDYIRAPSKKWRADGVVLNTIVALAILFAVWFVCEWWIRRRAARKGT